MKVTILVQMDPTPLRGAYGTSEAYIWYHDFNKLHFYSITGKEYTGPF
jgi:hypothetical protein